MQRHTGYTVLLLLLSLLSVFDRMDASFKMIPYACSPLTVKPTETLVEFLQVPNKMTISYDEEFSSLMLRWRGSLWKAVLKDLIAFYIGYYIILAIQVRFASRHRRCCKNNRSRDANIGDAFASAGNEGRLDFMSFQSGLTIKTT